MRTLLPKTVLRVFLATSISFSMQTSCYTPDRNQESMFTVDDPVMSEFLDTVGTDHLIHRMLMPEDVLAILLQIQAQDLLQQNFFLKTNVLARRNIIDQPLFDTLLERRTDNTLFDMQLFFSLTPRCRYTKDSESLSSYLALNDDTLLGRLEETVQGLKNLQPEFDFDPARVLSLFQDMRVVERQAGLMFFGHYLWKDYSLRWLLPFYYFERNFFLTDKELEEVEKEFGASTPQEQKKFQEKYLISDKFGTGDLRLEFNTWVLNKRFTKINAGLQLTLPTACAFAKGLKGSSFDRPHTYPHINLAKFIDLASDPNATLAKQEEIFNAITELSLGALSRLSANLLDAPLGNGGHVGIGIVVRTETLLKRYIDLPLVLSTRTSLEYLIPKHEQRFFINCVDTAAFDAIKWTIPDSEQVAQSMVDFLEQQALERLFLRSFDVIVSPRLIYRSCYDLSYTYGNWQTHVGLDGFLHAFPTIGFPDRCREAASRLSLAKTNPFLVYQSKMYLDIGRRFKHDTYTWYIHAGADGAMYSHGIGPNMSVTLGVRFEF
jgi:hypothetical protein